MRVLALTLALLLLLAGTAGAQGRLDRAAEELQLDPVYVDPDAEEAISERQADDLREAIADSGAGPMYLAVLPADAAREAGGDPGAALREIAFSVREPGTYGVVIGDEFRAAAEDPLPLFLVVLAVVAIGLFGLSRVRRRRRERAELAQVKAVTREDLVALGDDIRALDLDVEMPDVDAEAKEHYGRAVERYQQADEAWLRARRPSDMERVTSLLEEGRWAMTAAKATPCRFPSARNGRR